MEWGNNFGRPYFGRGQGVGANFAIKYSLIKGTNFTTDRTTFGIGISMISSLYSHVKVELKKIVVKNF